MDAGRLDRIIKLYTNTPTQNSTSGEEQRSTTLLATLWAEKRDLGSVERVRSDRTLAVNTATFITRHVDGVTQETILVEDATSTEWNITGIKEIGRREGLELLCEVLQ